jgi:glutamyl-Q tRNA(Asp) synthetase
VLQALLGLPTPRYRHHPLLTDASGRRLSKRDRSRTIRAMRAASLRPDDVIAEALSSVEPAKQSTSG